MDKSPVVSSEMSKKMKDKFLAGGLDPQLEHALSTSVPPGDVKALSMCRLCRRTCVGA